jgi:peroxiredoxin
VSDQQVFLSDGRQVSINDLLRDRRVLVLGFVAAYTRLCQQSLLAYSAQLSTLKKKFGIDGIVAIAVNDHSVLSSFSSSLSLPSGPGLSLVADFDARVTRWLGMEVDLSVVGFGLRCKRFAMLVDRQQVRVVRVEGNVGVLDVTSVESMSAVLTKMKEEEKKEKEGLVKDRPAGSREDRKDKEGGAAGLGAGGGSGLAVGAATVATDVQQQQSAQSEEELEEEQQKSKIPDLLH